MNEENPLPQQPGATPDSSLDNPRRLRLRFLAVVILIYWTLGFIVSHLEKPYFYGFLYGMPHGQ